MTSIHTILMSFALALFCMITIPTVGADMGMVSYVALTPFEEIQNMVAEILSTLLVRVDSAETAIITINTTTIKNTETIDENFSTVINNFSTVNENIISTHGVINDNFTILNNTVNENIISVNNRMDVVTEKMTMLEGDKANGIISITEKPFSANMMNITINEIENTSRHERHSVDMIITNATGDIDIMIEDNDRYHGIISLKANVLNNSIHTMDLGSGISNDQPQFTTFLIVDDTSAIKLTYRYTVTPKELPVILFDLDKTRYAVGDTIRINGTVTNVPNDRLVVNLHDQFGDVLFYDSLHISDDGIFNYTFVVVEEWNTTLQHIVNIGFFDGVYAEKAIVITS